MEHDTHIEEEDQERPHSFPRPVVHDGPVLSIARSEAGRRGAVPGAEASPGRIDGTTYRPLANWVAICRKSLLTARRMRLFSYRKV